MVNYTVIHAEGEVLENVEKASVLVLEMNSEYLLGVATYVSWRFDGSSEAIVVLSPRGYPVNSKDLAGTMSPVMEYDESANILSDEYEDYKYVLHLTTDIQSTVWQVIAFKTKDALLGFIDMAALLGYALSDFLILYAVNGKKEKLPKSQFSKFA